MNASSEEKRLAGLRNELFRPWKQECKQRDGTDALSGVEFQRDSKKKRLHLETGKSRSSFLAITVKIKKVQHMEPFLRRQEAKLLLQI